MLKPIGWWIETRTDETLPAPQELVIELPVDERSALTKYLADGLPLIQYRGYSWCRFGCGIQHSEMGSWDLTDGVWVWPQGRRQSLRQAQRAPSRAYSLSIVRNSLLPTLTAPGAAGCSTPAQ